MSIAMYGRRGPANPTRATAVGRFMVSGWSLGVQLVYFFEYTGSTCLSISNDFCGVVLPGIIMTYPLWLDEAIGPCWKSMGIAITRRKASTSSAFASIFGATIGLMDAVACFRYHCSSRESNIGTPGQQCPTEYSSGVCAYPRQKSFPSYL